MLWRVFLVHILGVTPTLHSVAWYICCFHGCRIVHIQVESCEVWKSGVFCPHKWVCFIILLPTHTPAFGNCSQMCGTHYNHIDCYVSCIWNKDSATHLQHVLCCSKGQRFSWRVNWCMWAMLVILRKEALRKVQCVLCSDISHYVIQPATETCHLNIHISIHW
jgi:hypothetical protein